MQTFVLVSEVRVSTDAPNISTETGVALSPGKTSTQTLQISFPKHLDFLTEDGLESAQVFLVKSLLGLSQRLSVTG